MTTPDCYACGMEAGFDQFAEAEGFAHVHFHIVPRMADLRPEHRGPGIFALLRGPEQERVSAEQADHLALALRAHLHPHRTAQ
ncbi:hypothetical protein AB0L42_43925 [Streptomyces sp. NPDC052287]|uniref:hypothetical protein n=1 Tax=Streptomyces sp. NPDC052287 TaxID=3154950 RepID=UPI00343480FF